MFFMKTRKIRKLNEALDAANARTDRYRRESERMRAAYDQLDDKVKNVLNSFEKRAADMCAASDVGQYDTAAEIARDMLNVFYIDETTINNAIRAAFIAAMLPRELNDARKDVLHTLYNILGAEWAKTCNAIESGDPDSIDDDPDGINNEEA